MKFDDLLKEEFLNEAAFAIGPDGQKKAINTKSKADQKKYDLTPMKKAKGQVINPEARYELTKEAKKHKYPEYKFDNYKKFKPGRERVVSAVIRRCKLEGVSVSSTKVRNFVYKFYNRWLSGGEPWLDKYEKAAASKGFNVRKYLEQERGDSAGVWRQEWKGRAQFFVPFMNRIANEFLPQEKWWGEYETFSNHDEYSNWKPRKWWGDSAIQKGGTKSVSAKKTKAKKEGKRLRSGEN